MKNNCRFFWIDFSQVITLPSITLMTNCCKPLISENFRKKPSFQKETNVLTFCYKIKRVPNHVITFLSQLTRGNTFTQQYWTEKWLFSSLTQVSHKLKHKIYYYLQIYYTCHLRVKKKKRKLKWWWNSKLGFSNLKKCILLKYQDTMTCIPI